MEILADNEISDIGEDTVGGDSEDEVYFQEKGTHNPGAPEFKSGARVVNLGWGGDDRCMGHFAELHMDG
jgi:hypothetical protein